VPATPLTKFGRSFKTINAHRSSKTHSVHYRVAGYLIRSENTAKPLSQASEFLTNWILSQGRVKDAVDFGCGRLRYSGCLAQRCDHLTLVDSQHQIERVQQLNGTRAHIRDYALSHWSKSRVLTFEAFERDRRKYDFVLCANVLPVVPDSRMRARIIREIASHLRTDGEALFVCQFRNSYFKQLPSFPGAKRHLSGWAVLRAGDRSSYYGILPKRQLEDLIKQHGFAVRTSWLVGQSAYVLGVPK
jgi:2-polyprenyl-3-methyl-5-hydroxy-6-metoxy-1,4-benzoquinol methylase